MIVYFDTSALVKAYITEKHSSDVLQTIKNAEVIATHCIAYVETQATFARLRRENRLSEAEFQIVKETFLNDWENYLQIENNLTLMKEAVSLAEAFGLRAYDSVHLASAKILLKQSGIAVVFACFDQQLNKAAKVLDLNLLLTN